MRLLVTADLHFNHRHSGPLARELIGRINRERADAVLVVGDTAAGDGDELEQCLSLFEFDGPKLFVAGNHELWTKREDSHALLTRELPDRVRGLGWRWLQTDPYVSGGVAVVGSVGWYDYSFADDIGIPTRFYAHKISPGAAQRFAEYAHLFDRADDVTPAAMDVCARWNDGKFVKLHRSDPAFLAELLDQLRAQLDALRDRRVIAAVHHVPFEELLPPGFHAQLRFARAYLGSRAMGDLLRQYANVTHVLCGHSHFPAQARIGSIDAINIGSGYRQKTYRIVEV